MAGLHKHTRQAFEVEKICKITDVILAGYAVCLPAPSRCLPAVFGRTMHRFSCRIPITRRAFSAFRCRGASEPTGTGFRVQCTGSGGSQMLVTFTFGTAENGAGTVLYEVQKVQ